MRLLGEADCTILDKIKTRKIPEGSFKIQSLEKVMMQTMKTLSSSSLITSWRSDICLDRIIVMQCYFITHT